MSTIQIEVTGTDYETVTLSLTSQEVANLYENSKSLKEEIKTLTKSVETEKQNYKWVNDRGNAQQAEINHANVLLTALGVQLQTTEEESYRRTDLPIATRIALYIATK